MRHIFSFFAIVFISSATLVAQEEAPTKTQTGHKNNNNFKQLYEEFATPNRFRTASGAPGVDYYQQQVDYIMDIELDDGNTKLYGEETILTQIILQMNLHIFGFNWIRTFEQKTLPL